MKFSLLGLVISMNMLWGATGEAIFKKHCTACHSLYISQNKLLSNFEHNNQELKLKAPTLNQLSFSLKDRIGDRKGDVESQLFEVENFIANYLEHPNKHKGVIPRYINKFFGVMPSMKGVLDEDEVEAVSQYIYEYSENMMIKQGVKRHTYEEALKVAKKEHKIIVIEGYLPYCRFCIRMDKEVLVENEVKKVLNKNFVLVKMNLLLEKLPLKIKRLGTPSFYFIGSEGKKIIEMVEGFGNSTEFIELLNDVKERSK